MTYKCFIYLESERKDKKVKQYSKINDPKQSTGESPIKTVRVQWSVAYYIQMNKGQTKQASHHKPYMSEENE